MPNRATRNIVRASSSQTGSGEEFDSAQRVLSRSSGGDDSRFVKLAILAIISIGVYGIITMLSWQFNYDSVSIDRPIIMVLCLFAIAFAAYLAAIGIAWRTSPNTKTLALLIGSAIVFRVVVLFSVPIQEVDIYRYLWDGAATTAGVSPFRYSPAQVSSAGIDPRMPDDLQRLAKLRDNNPPLAEILHRVHFAELPTIYPPTSQFVFALANLATPSSASLLTRLFVMKAWLVGFDIATLLVVIAILRRCGKPIGLCILYAWCPLLIKEVANSGHLDAIAVFLTTSAVYMVVRCLEFASTSATDEQTELSPTTGSLRAMQIGYATMAAIVFGLAVGAKLYPIILVPLVLFALLKQLGWRFTAAPALAFVVTVILLLSALLPSDESRTNENEVGDPSLGVVTFLRRWEMNDFLFLLVIENLKPSANRGAHEVAWFTVTPESFRQTVVTSAAKRLGFSPSEAPFIIARATTAIIFLIVAFVLAWRTAGKDITSFCEAVFLTIAWFWLLCPTLNPWYWTWALPFLAFARGRAWIAVSGLVLIYYLRFWLEYHFPSTAVLGSPYTGLAFYDFIVTWIEFAPWTLVLFAAWLWRRQTPLPQTS